MSHACWQVEALQIASACSCSEQRVLDDLFVCKEGGDASVAERNTVVVTFILVGPYREALSRQSRTALCLVWLCCD